jgi:hypothetical protein
MSNDQMSALEQALSTLEARQIKTQKQLEQLTNGFQQLQQLLLQQQSNSTSTLLPLPNNPTPHPVSLKPATRPLCPALPNGFNGDCSKGPTFIRSCQTYIILCLESFSDDQTKIVWALSYMKAGEPPNALLGFLNGKKKTKVTPSSWTGTTSKWSSARSFALPTLT